MLLKEKVKVARKNAGLTQEQLGEMVGITKQAVSLIEKGLTENPDKRTLKLIAQATNDDLGDPSLTQYLNGNQPSQSKREIIEKTSPDEYINLRYGGESMPKSKADLTRLKNLAEKKIRQIEEFEK